MTTKNNRAKAHELMAAAAVMMPGKERDEKIKEAERLTGRDNRSHGGHRR